MKKHLYQIQKIIFAVIFSLFSFYSAFAQIGGSKIKDGTISTGPENARIGAIFELESNNKGMLTSRLTTAQRDAIPVTNLSDGLFIFNTTTGCFDYWSVVQDAWLSICGTPPPAELSIVTAQCEQIVTNGVYKQGVAFTLSNYMTIPVTVSQPGTYTISVSTLNGYYFNTSGTFPSAGSYILNLAGSGTPNKGYVSGENGDVVSIILNGIKSTCSPYIFVVKANVDFAIICASIDPQGNYFIGTPLTSDNKLTLSVDVSNTGFWSINTNTVNGYSFSGSGNFASTGVQTIELVGTGTPETAGVNSFNISSNATTIAGASCSEIIVTVAPVAFTIDCENVTQNGSYMQDVALTGANVITLPINVTATGATTITTNEINGMSFTSGPISLTTLGVQNVVLTGTGTPLTSGTTALIVTATAGIAANCTVNVNVAAQPVTYAMDCNSIKVNGSYAPGSVMTAGNTIAMSVNVTYKGDYLVATNTVNGVSFSASGIFTSAGIKMVELKATGTPLAGGEFTYIISSNSTSGRTSCSMSIVYSYRKMNILGLGGGMYQPATATGAQGSNAIIASSVNFGSSGTVRIAGIEIINGGTNQGTELKNRINNNSIDIIVIGYNYRPNAASRTVLDNFVKNKKGVLIHSQENDSAGAVNLINTICGSSSASIVTTGQSLINPILNVSDPLLKGPFGDIRELATGSDVNNSYYVTGLPSQATALATQNGNSSRIWALKHNTLGYVFVGDSGWTAGTSSNTSLNIWPAKISGTGLPMSKNYYGGVTVYNSIMYANTIAWAINYVQENIDPTYIIP